MTIHGHKTRRRVSPEYHVWVGMKQRCRNSRHKSFEYYGGRGIIFQASWRYFENFLADMGKRPKGKTLDRINVNGNYTRRNCRWSNWSTQIRNRRPY